MFDVVAFDADDTLWPNEHLYILKRDRFIELLQPFADPHQIGEGLDETEIANLHYYGYGIKSFVLSMVETAVSLTNGRVSGETIQAILQFGKEMRDHPVQLFEGVTAVLDELQPHYQLMIITKGDLFEQESKIARSGIADRFRTIEVVSKKEAETYDALLHKFGIAPSRFLMVGNSLRSDILPVVEIGGTAVHIPHTTTWAHEHVPDADRSHYTELTHISQLTGWLAARP
ncbi:MAG: HAD family hydrolase [Anaerolineae bacterium]|nr:HAD family hydrolase [Anaerolineae bacterium]